MMEESMEGSIELPNRRESSSLRSSINSKYAPFETTVPNSVDLTIDGPNLKPQDAPDLSQLSSIFQSQHPVYDPDLKLGFQNFEIQNEHFKLSKVNALVNTGELCLVLADNSTTTSTFLRAVNGDYKSSNEFPNSILTKTNTIFNDEVDVHFPHLTVDQTIQFAIDCKFEVDSDTKQKIKMSLLEAFGLSHCLNTIVGNDYVRGISGGERKRISIIESLIASGLVYLWDNSTKGLDSSSALEFIKSLKKMTQLTKVTHFIGINQVSEKMIGLFDKVLLFYQNRQIFFGTIEELLQFLKDQGIHKTSSQTDIEFLNEVMSSDLNVENIESQWKSSKYFHQLERSSTQELSKPLRNVPSSSTSSYKISTFKQLKYCFQRNILRSKGDRAYIISQSLSTVVQALVIGSLFYNMPMDTIGSFSRGSIIFFSLLFFAFVALAEVPSCFTQRPIVNKQKRFSFYHPAIETFSKVLNDLVFKFALNLVFAVILYFLAGFQSSGARFFVFLLFLFLTTENMTLLFQDVALLSPTVAIANAISGILMLSIAMYASYVIYTKQMHPWFKWISYINPVRYGFETMLSNELFNVDLNCTKSFIPSGGEYDEVPDAYKVCGWQGANIGQDYVEGKNYLMKSFAYSYSNTWRNFGILIAFIVFFLVIGLLAAEFVTVKYTGKQITDHANSRIPENPVDIDCETMENVDRLKFEKNVTLSWEGVSYRVNNRDLLDDVCGYVSSGALTALMGESGAGKTTLLNVLSNRVDSGVATGQVLVNNMTTNDSGYKSNTGYVQQQDIHIQELTVRESMEFSCKLRGDGDLKYVDWVSQKLKLPSEMLVKKLSSKDQKMLSIGVELVTKPIILFLDEPTSGLENESALDIVKILKDLSASGQAILCTIHQPSTAIFKLFDNLLLLQKGGRTVYFGNADNSCTDYFYKNGAELIHENENPAEYILKVSGGEGNSDWSKIWNNSSEHRETLEVIKDIKTSEKTQSPLYSKFVQPSYSTQFLLVLQRTWRQFIRDLNYLAAKFGLMIIAGLYIGFTFWKVKHSVMGLQNLMFAMFMVLVISSPLIQQIQAKSLSAKNVFLAREQKSNTFHWSILVLSQVCIEIPFVFLGSTLLFLCFYFTIGASAVPGISGVFYLNYLLFSLYYLTFGLWLIYSCPNLETAHVFVAFLFSFTVSFCGVMQPKELMPKFWLFMYRISPYTYFVDTFVSLVMHNKPVVCESGEYALLQSCNGQTCGDYMEEYIERNGGYLLHPESTFICSYCVYDNGDQFLDQQNLSCSHIWRNFGILWVYIGFNFAAMIAGFYYFNIKGLNLKQVLKSRWSVWRKGV